MKNRRLFPAALAAAALAMMLAPVSPARAFDPFGEAKKAACKKLCDEAKEKCAKECRAADRDACEKGCRESSKKCDEKCVK